MKIAVLTHNRPAEVIPALEILREQAKLSGAELFFDSEPYHERSETVESHGDHLNLIAQVPHDCDLCLTLGGDGTILKGLRTFAGTQTPIFAINFGEIGFLATVEREQIKDGILRALNGDYDVLKLPVIQLKQHGEVISSAFNDISVHRQHGARVARLAYSVEQQEIGQVRCDGLVVSTPAGSTGYNLANGGPVLAWGVKGYVVSFIAPHSLTARSLVVAPDDILTLTNRSQYGPVDLSVDGRPFGTLDPDDSVDLQFINAYGHLAQLPHSSFYRRIGERFGRLSA